MSKYAFSFWWAFLPKISKTKSFIENVVQTLDFGTGKEIKHLIIASFSENPKQTQKWEEGK